MRSDSGYLEFIDESIRLVPSYTQAGYEHLESDIGNQDQVIRPMEIIADATARLSTQLQERHPDVPWRQIKDFRNSVAHGYMDVDLQLVWQAVQRLPELERVVEDELERDRSR